MRHRHHRDTTRMMAHPHSLAAGKLHASRPRVPSAYFYHCVADALAIIEDSCAEAVTNLDIGVEDVPDTSASLPGSIPLAWSVSERDDEPAQIILFRRPIERLASNRQELRQLIYTSLLEQIAASTRWSVAHLDPKNLRGE